MAPSADLLRTTDESQGLGRKFRNGFGWLDRSRVNAEGPQIAFVTSFFGGIGVHWRDSAAFWARGVDPTVAGVLLSGVVGVRLLVGASR